MAIRLVALLSSEEFVHGHSGKPPRIMRHDFWAFPSLLGIRYNIYRKKCFSHQLSFHVRRFSSTERIYVQCKSFTAGMIRLSISVSGSPSGRLLGSRGSSLWVSGTGATLSLPFRRNGTRIQRSGLPGETKTCIAVSSSKVKERAIKKRKRRHTTSHLRVDLDYSR